MKNLDNERYDKKNKCLSVNKCKAMCSGCCRDVNLADINDDMEFYEYDLTKVRNFKTGATHKCDGYLKRKGD